MEDQIFWMDRPGWGEASLWVCLGRWLDSWHLPYVKSVGGFADHDFWQLFWHGSPSDRFQQIPSDHLPKWERNILTTTKHAYHAKNVARANPHIFFPTVAGKPMLQMPMISFVFPTCYLSTGASGGEAKGMPLRLEERAWGRVVEWLEEAAENLGLRLRPCLELNMVKTWTMN